MIVAVKGSEYFHIGFFFSIAFGFEIHFGWNSVSMAWGRGVEHLLKSLPVVERPGNCLSCAATDFSAWNQDEFGRVKDCNKCGGYPGGPQ